MEFSNLLSRADDEALQELLGRPTVRLAQLLQRDKTKSGPDQLKEILLATRPAQELLLDSASRSVLVQLLRPAEAEDLKAQLGLNGDAYRSLASLSIRKGGSKESTLLAYFGLAPLEPEETDETLTIEEIETRHGLFPHQRRAAVSVSTALESDPYRVLLHMPTGAGKTRTAMHCIVDHLRRHEPTIVVWLAHSEELCSQAADEFRNAWSALGNRKLPILRHWGSHSVNVRLFSDGFLVAGLSKSVAAMKRDIGFVNDLGARASLVVLDEAHQAIAPTYSTLLEGLVVRRPTNRLLGLTATPGRTWLDVDEDKRLASFFRRRKVTLAAEGYENPIDFLVADRFLARVTAETLLSGSGIALTAEDRAYVQTHLEIPPRVLERLGEDDQRNLVIALKVEQLAASHERIIAFCASVRHSETLAAALRSRGLEARSVTTKTPSSERHRVIEDFKSPEGKTRVLCNFGVLTTGFDAPRTSAAVIARPTLSLVLYSQMVGRAIRGPRAGGNAEAVVVTVHDPHLPGFGSVAASFFNWEDVWS